MINTQIITCAIPAAAWQDTKTPGQLGDYWHENKRIEERCQKGVNLENEYLRYVRGCEKITSFINRSQVSPLTSQQLAVATDSPTALADFRSLLTTKIPALISDQNYLLLLRQLLFQEENKLVTLLTRNFCAPSELANYTNTLKQLAHSKNLFEQPLLQARLIFLDLCLINNCGFLEVQNTCFWQDQIKPPPLLAAPQLKAKPELPDTLPETAEYSEDMTLSEKVKSLVLKAITDNNHQELSNFSNKPHNVITEVLHDFVYQTAAQNPAALPLIYADGSRGADFPLFSLPIEQTPFPTDSPVYRVALLSMRHFELDAVVDFCWFRNREVSQTRSLAETATFCEQVTKRQLAELHENGGGTLHLYQTGFQPAIIGFYKALVEDFLAHPNSPTPVRVIPQYYARRQNAFVPGQIWSNHG